VKDNIRQLFGSTYKSVLGRGPASISVMEGNRIIRVQVDGSLTQMEKQALVATKGSVIYNEVISCILKVRWEAFSAGKELQRQVEGIIKHKVSMEVLRDLEKDIVIYDISEIA
jgi:uncharacterized protein YbcI